MSAAPIDPDAIDEATVVRTGSAVGTLLLDGQVVVVDERRGLTHALNGTGSIVWQCLDGSGPLADLVDDLTAEFASPREVIATDVVAVVQSFGALGLLDVVPTDGTPPRDAEPPNGDGSTAEPGSADPSFDDRYLAAPPNG